MNSMRLGLIKLMCNAGMAAILFVGPFAKSSGLDLYAYRGKLVYLDFWASWCAPCRQSFPWLSEIQSRYGAQNIVIVAVNLDHDRAKAERFLSEIPARFPIFYDPSGTLATEYKVKAMPSSFLIDRDGRIRYEHHGFSPKEIDQYERQIVSLLEEKPAHENP